MRKRKQVKLVSADKYNQEEVGCLVKKGSTRVVIALGSVVIKLPRAYSWAHFLRGMLANLNERLFWKELKHPRLARVYYADIFGLVLVMERAGVILNDSDNEEKAVVRFFDECESVGLPVDRKASNIGYFSAFGYKLIDYGG